MKRFDESEAKRHLSYAILELDRKIKQAEEIIADSLEWEHDRAEYWVESKKFDLQIFQAQRDALVQINNERFA